VRIAYFNANMRVGQDGVTRVMYKMMNEARARGNEVMALTSTLPQPGLTDIPMFKVPSVVLPLQKAYRIALPGYQLFAKRLHEFRPDVLHINSPCTLGFGAVKYAAAFNVPVVATYHTHFPTYPRYYGFTKLEGMVWRITRHLYNNVDRTFVPTMPILDELSENGINRLSYLPNGVDRSLFHPRHRSSEWRDAAAADGKPVILFVSRLVWEKDLEDLAKTYALLKQRRNDFEMVVVGDGYARKDFEPMMPGARFLGYQTGLPLSQSFASADIFLFPSTTETFGLVTVEAMASGLTPVAAGYGGAVGIIEDNKSGLLSKPHDPGDMAAKIEWLLNNASERRRMRINALRRAEHFDWKTILEQLFEEYADVLRRHHAGKRRAA